MDNATKLKIYEAAKSELMKHNQFIFHLADDVLPAIIEQMFGDAGGR